MPPKKAALAKVIRKDTLAKQVHREGGVVMPCALQHTIPQKTMVVLKRLTSVKAPLVLMAAIYMILTANPSLTQWLDSLETFAGKHEVTKAFTAHFVTCPSFGTSNIYVVSGVFFLCGTSTGGVHPERARLYLLQLDQMDVSFDVHV
jgi:hypothetical protein